MRKTIIRFAIAIVCALGFAGLFSLYTETLSAEQQEEVLIKAIPFVAIFVAILLVFICCIALLAINLNGRIPPRTHQPIEYVIIAGILLGVIGLFQGWKLFAYENGFLLLLFSVLAFIVWSHITPMPRGAAKQLPGFSRRAQRVGLVAGVVVWLGLSVFLSLSLQPQEPYSVAPRVWEMVMDDDEKQQMRDEFNDEYRFNRIPLAIAISLLPGAIAFFAVREFVASRQRDTDLEQARAPGPEGAHALPG